MTEEQIREKLINLYQEMYELTRPECEKCRVPLSCCSGEYCAITLSYAEENWKISLPITDHPALPLMGPKGCTAAPHLRPICTVHTCDINCLGFKRDDIDDSWSDKYYDLRSDIELLEIELLEIELDDTLKENWNEEH